jgi:adenosylcobinamide-phosphate synthase
MNLLVAFLSLVIDQSFGYPAALQRTIRHPVQWMGALLDWIEPRANRPEDAPGRQRVSGASLLVILLVVSVLPALLIADILHQFAYGWVVEGLLAAPFLAQKSLDEAVRAVAVAFDTSLFEARAAVSQIVGRDTDTLDESGVSRGAIESLAESTSDGVVAPLFWLVLLGLPGIVLYKAVNTADSMLGHRNTRFEHFGWASAKLDDVLNWIPARLTALLVAGAALAIPGADAVQAMSSALRDAPKHASPNAGWPEAAMAGALGISLGGPRAYRGEVIDLARMGSGRTKLARNDIVSALVLYRIAMLLLGLLFAVLGFLAIR